VREQIPHASERKICEVLGVSRSSCQPGRKKREKRLHAIVKMDQDLVTKIQQVIQQHPTYGYRRIWAILRHRQGLLVNKKAVYRILKLKRWFLHHREKTPRPRVKGRRSIATESDSRWAIDITHIPCGRDGWGHLVALIDCHDRSCVGFEFALRGRANEAERALEDACINRFGTTRSKEHKPIIRSDNGLVFQSKRFRDLCRDYGLPQEFVTPYTPEQNGMIERFFRSLKEECVWLKDFLSFEEARQAVTQWIHWYNEGRPHQELGYLSPEQYRLQQAALVA